MKDLRVATTILLLKVWNGRNYTSTLLAEQYCYQMTQKSVPESLPMSFYFLLYSIWMMHRELGIQFSISQPSSPSPRSPRSLPFFFRCEVETYKQLLRTCALPRVPVFVIAEQSFGDFLLALGFAISEFPDRESREIGKYLCTWPETLFFLLLNQCG